MPSYVHLKTARWGKRKDSVLTKGKVENTYNIQQTMTVISLEHWKKKSVDRSTYSINFLSSSTSINSWNSKTVSLVKYRPHLLTLSLMHLLLKYIKKYKNVLSKRQNKHNAKLSTWDLIATELTTRKECDLPGSQ